MALYIERDFFHEQTSQLAHRFTQPIPFVLLFELELHIGVRRNLARNELSVSEHDSIFRQIAEDESAGILMRQPISQSAHFAKARQLSKRHTPQIMARSLDIFQVAAALLLKASALASFDDRQRQLAMAAGLRVVPQLRIKSKPIT